MKILFGEKISDESFQWLLLHLNKGQEYKFIDAHRGGQCAIHLGTGKLYEKGWELGAHYCGACDTQYPNGVFLNFIFKVDRISRICDSCREKAHA